MTLSWPYLALALVLLWTPLVRCLGRNRRCELLHAEGNRRTPALALLQVGWNWLDLLRAGSGAWLLVTFAILPPLDPKLSAMPAVGARVAVLAVGIVVQTLGSSHRFDRVVAPLFYLPGLMIALLPWQGVVFGGLLGLIAADMMRAWIHVFWLMPFTLAAALTLFGDLGLPAVLYSSLWFLPAIIRLVRPDHSRLWVLAGVPRDGIR